MTERTGQFEENRQRFNDATVVSDYTGTTGLSRDEVELFGRFVRPGLRILDLGVGTGRTSKPLSDGAAAYVGIDIAENMVLAARQAHPGLDFRVGDATNLSEFADASFDVVVFSYNGLDYLHPDARRASCLGEVRRVLTPEGVFILTRHNPAALLARRGSSGGGLRNLVVAFIASVRRARRLIPTTAFWRGEGYVTEPFRGGLVTHMATPRRVRAELAVHGFRHELTLGADARHRTRALWTPWYSYAFGAPERARLRQRSTDQA